MRLILTTLITLMVLFVNAQTNYRTFETRSPLKKVYRISADSAEKYINSKEIPVQQFENAIPYVTFYNKYVNDSAFATGYYVVISLDDIYLTASIICKTNLLVYPINNKQNLQVQIRNKEGVFIGYATVYVNKKQATYNAKTTTYWVKQKQPDEAFIKVYTLTDTLFYSFNSNDDVRMSPSKQCWRNFKISKVGRILLWLPEKVKQLFEKKNKRYNNSNTKSFKAKGYMLFNQPKYKLTDTVKLKACLINRKDYPLTESLDIFLEYYARGSYKSQLLQKELKPVSTGSYVYQFALNDTLLSDVRYTIKLKNKDGKDVYTGNFNTEDYVLNDIATYEFKIEKTNYYPNDSMIFKAKALDANGLNMLDVKGRLILLKRSISHFYEDSMYVTDTLAIITKPLLATNETEFVVKTSNFPKADIEIRAVFEFQNSNNETQTKELALSYKIAASELVLKQVKDSIYADYRVNGKSVKAVGQFDVDGMDGLKYTRKINYPSTIKIDPLVETYSFDVTANDSIITTTEIEIKDRLSLGFWQINNSDTLGFHLMNEYKVPVTYQVYNGNTIVASGMSDAASIIWQQKMNNKRQTYVVKWQFYWGGEQKNGSESIGLLYKNLRVNIKAKDVVFPGEKDSITITAVDYKNKPASNVNIAVASYNSKFGSNNRMPKLPFLATYKSRKKIDYDTYDIEDALIKKSYSIYQNKKWLALLKADTSFYYQLLHPTDTITDIVIPIEDFYPQTAVHITEKGVPQKIFILYINRKAVYFSGATNNKPFAFASLGGYTQIGIRLKDKYIEIDSIYIQPNLKHNFVFDVDNLPRPSFIKPMDNWLSNDERRMLENLLLRYDNAGKYFSAYVWQYDNVEKINQYSQNILGPFLPNDSVQFFAPHQFDIKFKFKPGFTYTASPKLIEAVKEKIFKDTGKVYLHTSDNFKWNFTDTLSQPPTMEYPTATITPTIYYRHNSSVSNKQGNLIFSIPQDSLKDLRYTLLVYPNAIEKNIQCYVYSNNLVSNIDTGIYYLTFITKNWKYLQMPVNIKANATLCINIKKTFENLTDSVFEKFQYNYTPIIEKPIVQSPTIITAEQNVEPNYISYSTTAFGNNTLKIKVTDDKGASVAGASILIKNSRKGVVTNVNGRAEIRNLPVGKIALHIAAIGLDSKNIETNISDGTGNVLLVKLVGSSSSIEEVVVQVGYGTVKKTAFTGSEGTVTAKDIRDYTNALEGRVAGLSATNGGGAPGSNNNIIIRGIGSIDAGAEPLYVVDGIIVDAKSFAAMAADDLASVDVLKDAAATSLYGSRAVNGVIVITTKRKINRTIFKDYAIWQPELITDKNGQARFTITYPDNINGWNTYAFAMDGKRRNGKGFKFVKSFKPLSAELALPTFLIEGDKVNLIGKAFNHSNENYNINTIFTATNNAFKNVDTILNASSAVINNYEISTPFLDTLTTSFLLKTSTGYKDVEERKLPILKQGTEETDGYFETLFNDTTINYHRKDTSTPFTINAQVDGLQILLDEAENIKKYPYYCMEQTASKLKGMLLQKQIKKQLNEPFNDDKEIDFLKQKLIKSQLFSGGWAWWQDGNANYNITNYILNALSLIKDDSVVNYTIRNGALFLQNNLSKLNTSQLLYSLQTMSNLGHSIDCNAYLKELHFDSLTTHQQWQMISIYQNTKMPYQSMLDKLLKQVNTTMINGIYWGNELYDWSYTRNMTTNLAFNVLRKDGNYENLLPKIAQYLLHQRKNGYWRNTVESATIANTLLPYFTTFKTNNPVTLTITGDTNFVVNQLPFTAKFSEKNIKNIAIQKSGSGIGYFTAYQKFWNKSPEANYKNFDIKTSFKQTGNESTTLIKGQKTTMLATITSKEDAEYVMIEIPIPAGCIYASKKQNYWAWQKEFYKNKMLLFVENLPKGTHQIEVELECRYSGNFTLNPAKVELMYFPTFYGRNEMKKLKID